MFKASHRQTDAVELRRSHRYYFPIDDCSIDGIEVVLVLDIEPVLRAGSEETCEPGGRVRGDRALAIHDQTDSIGWDSNRPSQAVDADTFVIHILDQYLPRMNRRQLFRLRNLRFLRWAEAHGETHVG